MGISGIAKPGVQVIYGELPPQSERQRFVQGEEKKGATLFPPYQTRNELNGLGSYQAKTSNWIGEFCCRTSFLIHDFRREAGSEIRESDLRISCAVAEQALNFL